MESNWRYDAWRWSNTGADPLLAARILEGPYSFAWLYKAIFNGNPGTLGALWNSSVGFYSYFFVPIPAGTNFPHGYVVSPD